MINQTKYLIWLMFLSKLINVQRDPKTTKVLLKKQTGSNQDSVIVEISFKQNKQETGKNQVSVPPL